MPKRVPSDPGRPTPRESIARARAAAGPKVAKAMESAAPKVEKAANQAGKLLGTLRDRARTTAQEFADAYRGEDDDEQRPAAPPAGRPRPRPRPHKD
jgi:hypothetical protein